MATSSSPAAASLVPCNALASPEVYCNNNRMLAQLLRDSCTDINAWNTALGMPCCQCGAGLGGFGLESP